MSGGESSNHLSGSAGTIRGLLPDSRDDSRKDNGREARGNLTEIRQATLYSVSNVTIQKLNFIAYNIEGINVSPKSLKNHQEYSILPPIGLVNSLLKIR